MNNKDLNLLIVDDRPENLLVLESLLEPLGINIIKASSGNEALRLTLEYEIFLVLMDVQMPEMNGFETAELMRGSKKTRNIPIIFVTAINKEQQYVFKGYELGAVDYLFKPIEPIVLTSKVKVFIEMSKKNYLLKKRTKLLEEKIEELIQLRECNCKLENMSFCDGLTGINNRRRFDETLEQEWKRAIREQSSLSIIMMDIDNFKFYNDSYGHLAGDECLKKVAKCLEESVKRSSDFVARYGGEEFVVLLPNTDNEGAVKVGENIRKQIEKLNIENEYSKVANIITVSIGVNTERPNLDDNIEAFIDSADKALYKAKKTGRNKVVTAN